MTRVISPYPPKENTSVENEQSCCSKRSTHIIISLVIAIIGCAGASLAAYFLTQQDILWTSLVWTGVAGGGTFTFLFITTYVGFRVLFRNAEPAVSQPQKEPIQKVNQSTIQTTKSKTPVELQSTDKTAYSTKVELTANTKDQGSVKKEIIFERKNLPDLIGNMDEKFPEMMGTTVYIDPTNGLPIPLARLYQEMLSHPACGSKPVLLWKFFAAELLNIYNDKGMNVVLKYLYALNGTMINEIGARIPLDKPNGIKLKDKLENYQDDLDEDVSKLVTGNAELNTEIVTDYQATTFYLGVGRDDITTPLHAIAQLLSAHLKNVITEKMLIDKCQGDLERIASHYKVQFHIIIVSHYEGTITELFGPESSKDILRIAKRDDHYFPIWIK